MTEAISKKPSVKYRPDIDGLRAVAVLLVLAYHLGIHRFRGGFVGVDVFFVISGFLISSIILADLDAERFSILTFYERRVRRIAPALAVMLLGTAILAYTFFLPTEFVDFGKSFLAATFSFSNFFFLHQSGYFDAPAAMKPLLHTWSLAVEEQFYVFLPLFLLGVRKFFPDKQRLCIASVALLSFVVSVFGAFHNHDATFYLAHTRAWELLLGTLLSIEFFPAITGTVWRNVASISGALLILLAGLLFNPTTPFPGAAALLPCGGAALVIAAGKSGKSLVGQALSQPPVVFIGLISYSLYLWHWPLIVFQGADGLLIKGFSPKLTKLAVIAASFVLATLSWRFVEPPFRAHKTGLARRHIFALAGGVGAILLVIGAGILSMNGIPSRFPQEAVRVASFLENTDAKTDGQYRVGSCFLTSKDTYGSFNPSICLQQDPTKPNDLLIGDSHAAQLWFGLSSVYKDVNLMQATSSGCKPTLDQSHSVEEKCSRLMEYIFGDYLQTHRVDRLIIAARWDGADLTPLQQTLAWAHAHNIKVVLFGPIVQYDAALPRLLALSLKSNDLTIPSSHRVAYYQRLDLEMAKVAQVSPDVRYVSYFQMLCHDHDCLEYASAGVPLQSDYGHLTSGGSVLVATRLRDSGVLN